jgi:SAM-dependent methyltransferase
MKFYEDVRPMLDKRATGFDFVFSYLKDIKDPFIVETGCARIENNYAGDGQSSLLFDKYINEYGGEFITIDLSPASVENCRKQMICPRTAVVESDSVAFLQQLNENLKTVNKKIDFLYLDSFDWTPELQVESATHHLKELEAIYESLKPGALVGVDDNWLTGQTRIGKGWLVLEYFQKLGVPPIFDGYQIFWLKK